MESATVVTPLAPTKAEFCVLSEPNIPEGPEYENKTNTIWMHYIKIFWPILYAIFLQVRKSIVKMMFYVLLILSKNWW